jgi:hypothetical protein
MHTTLPYVLLFLQSFRDRDHEDRHSGTDGPHCNRFGVIDRHTPAGRQSAVSLAARGLHGTRASNTVLPPPSLEDIPEGLNHVS